MTLPVRCVVAIVAIGLISAGCSSGGTRDNAHSGAIIAVPKDAPTISAAVAKAKSGDLVLISPGTYRETVNVKTAGITLRGADRNTVILDEQVLRPNGIVVTAPNVTVQNLTVRNATFNGVLITGLSDANGGLARGSDGYSKPDPAKFPPLQGFHVDHVTSYNNGLYGIYAFDAQYGLIENSYASGGADSGLYVGQCKPCHTVVRGNVAERNAVGYEGDNAGPDLIVTGNRFAGNRVGATTGSDYQEAFLPQQSATIVGNVIAANDQARTPKQADGGFGVGFAITGGTLNLVRRNLIAANPTAGLVIASHEDLAPTGNTIDGNVFTANALDVSYSPTSPATGNCFEGNSIATAAPAGVTATLSCPAASTPAAGVAAPASQAPAGIPFTEVAAPPVLPSLPAPAQPPPSWRTGDLPSIDTAAVPVPAASLLADQSSTRW